MEAPEKQQCGQKCCSQTAGDLDNSGSEMRGVELCSPERRRHFVTEQAKIFKALGHPTRLLMVDALRSGELCVCELQALVGDDMSTVSNHLALLRAADVVLTEKRGKNIYYRLSMPCLNSFLECTGDMVRRRARLVD